MKKLYKRIVVHTEGEKLVLGLLELCENVIKFNSPAEVELMWTVIQRCCLL